MKRIGNVSGSKSRQVESDPDKEEMRQELRRVFREEKIRRRVQKHIGEITGERDLSESVVELLDVEGQPPPNAPIESIIKQQQSLADQVKWLDAWAYVFEKKLRALDKDRYWRERIEIEQAENAELHQRREKKGLDGIEEPDGRAGELLKSLGEAIQSSYQAALLRKYLDADDLDAPVLGIRRITTGLRCVFAEYIDDNEIENLSVDEQYDLIREQLTWIGVMAAEIRSKIRTIIEISEAALSFMDDAARKGGD